LCAGIDFFCADFCLGFSSGLAGAAACAGDVGGVICCVGSIFVGAAGKGTGAEIGVCGGVTGSGFASADEDIDAAGFGGSAI
jgi:hypothetical protein